MSLFNGKGSLVGTLNQVTDTMILSVIFLVSCIPLVTIGAAFTALYYTANKVQRHNRGYLLQEYARSFKRNFNASTLAWLLFLILWVVIGGDLYFVLRVMPPSELSAFLNIFFILIAALSIVWASYVFPYIARFQDTVRVSIKNCALLMLLHFPSSLLLLLLAAGSALSLWLFFPLALIVPGVFAIWQGDILEGVFRRYMSEEDRKKEDELNL